tara:strand:- start:615 stop:1172 length:558 start_codon:yes stop_codon:yes gene_type:complete
MSKHLSNKRKLELLPFLIERDGGFVCYYCRKSLDIKNMKFEHLNSNRSDHRSENLVLACQSCNIKKINDIDMRLKAAEKLKENEDKNFVRERKIEEKQNATTEIDINMSNYDITKQHLTEIIGTDGSAPFSNALNSCTFLCKEQTGHGSQQAIRNYIAILTSDVGPFMIIRDSENKKVIVKRTDS